MPIQMETPLSRRAMLKSALATSAVVAAPGLGQTARPAAAQTPVAPGDPDELFRALDEFITTGMAELQVPGVALGVILGDREHTAGFGVTNLDHPLPVDAETLFQIGSTGKTHTGTALMRLVEQGKIDLEAPVRDYLPDFRVADEDVSEQVRVRHLVTHTGGWFGDDFTDTGFGDDALANYVAEMADLRQIAPLGEHFSYNNAAISTAGRVIEVVTGQTFEAAIADLVLAPLGLEETFLFPREVMTQAFAVGHAPPLDYPKAAPSVVAEWVFPRAITPAGGEISSVADQLRYARFHLGDGTVDGVRVMSPETLAFMQQPHGPGGGHAEFVLDGVGITWLLTTIGGERIVMHGGSTNGQQSSFLMVPGRGFAITVLTNADAGAVLAHDATLWALEHFLDLRLPELTPVAATPEQLAEYAGEYDAGNGLLLAVAEGEGGMTLAITIDGEPLPGAAGPLPLVAEDRAAFEFFGMAMLTDFVRDDAGEVAWLRFSSRLAPRLS
jgi:CubicO group peptidase (beta-lactamase class C family)